MTAVGCPGFGGVRLLDSSGCCRWFVSSFELDGCEHAKGGYPLHHRAGGPCRRRDGAAMNLAANILAGLLAAFFLSLGAAKVLAVPRMRTAADKAGYSITAYRGIGILEMAGAAGLVVGMVVPALGTAAGRRAARPARRRPHHTPPPRRRAERPRSRRVFGAPRRRVPRPSLRERMIPTYDASITCACTICATSSPPPSWYPAPCGRSRVGWATRWRPPPSTSTRPVFPTPTATPPTSWAASSPARHRLRVRAAANPPRTRPSRRFESPRTRSWRAGPGRRAWLRSLLVRAHGRARHGGAAATTRRPTRSPRRPDRASASAVNDASASVARRSFASPKCRCMASLASRCLARTITQRHDVADSGQSAMATTGQILLTAHSRHSSRPPRCRGATRRFVPSDVPPTQRSSVRSA